MDREMKCNRNWLVMGITAVVCLSSAAAFADSRYGYETVPAARKAGKFSINTQVSAFTGDYGDPNDKTTTVGYFTETFKYSHTDIGEIGVSVPYVYRNGGGVTAGETSLVSARAIPKRADGIGDVLLKGKYYLLDENGDMPAVDITGRVKFPTASRERGFGTGKYDFGAGPSLMKHFGDAIVLLDVEAIARQRPRGSTIKKLRVDYSVGAGYPFTSKINGYVFLEGSSKTNKNQKSKDAPMEVVAAATYKPGEKLRFNGYVLVRLTDGSPDLGGSVGVTFYF